MTLVAKENLSRIVLGTVQLGLAYGRRMGCPPPDAQHAAETLDAAWEIGVRAFDTAEAYGEAAERLSNWIVHRGIEQYCEVVTKVRAAEVRDSAAIRVAWSRFRGVGRCTMLTHGIVSAAVFAEFSSQVIRLGATPGASVYEAAEVSTMAEAGARRIQAPLNVLDLRQRKAASDTRVPFDGRSIFLQGVLLEKPNDAERRAPGTGRLAAAVSAAAGDANVSPASALIAAALTDLGAEDRIVVGVDVPEELSALRDGCMLDRASVEHFRDSLHRRLGAEPVSDRVLDPRLWSLA